MDFILGNKTNYGKTQTMRAARDAAMEELPRTLSRSREASEYSMTPQRDRDRDFEYDMLDSINQAGASPTIERIPRIPKPPTPPERFDRDTEKMAAMVNNLRQSLKVETAARRALEAQLASLERSAALAITRQRSLSAALHASALITC